MAAGKATGVNGTLSNLLELPAVKIRGIKDERGDIGLVVDRKERNVEKTIERKKFGSL